MESSPLGHIATGASFTSTTNAPASGANDYANAASNGSVASPNETDLWGALSPMGDSAPPHPFTDMQPVINVSQAPQNQSSAANPFDAFDAFAPSSSGSSTSTLVLPPPAPHANTVMSLGSPLISFSPVASSSTTATATAAASTSAFAVDDLLSFSFSPVAAPPASLSSSSSLMMDDFFFGPSSTSTTTSTETYEATTAFASAVETLTVAETTTTTTTTTTTSSLLSFSPVAHAVSQTPFPDSFGDSDLTGFSRGGSFGGFEDEAAIDHIAPHSAPAAFGESNASLLMAKEDFNASVLVVTREHSENTPEEETHAVEADEGVNSPSADAAEVPTPTVVASSSGDSGVWYETDAHEEAVTALEEELVVATASGRELLAAVADGAVVEGDCQRVDSEDQPKQHLEVFDHDQDGVHTVEEESAPETIEYQSSGDLITAVADDCIVELVSVEASVAELQQVAVDHSAIKAVGPADEEVSESVLSPVSSGAEGEDGDWQTQHSPVAEPVAVFEALSVGSGHESWTSDVAGGSEEFTALDDDEDDYAERESVAMESQFESEAIALYAEVHDDEDESTSAHHDDHPVLNVSVAQLHLPLPPSESNAQSAEDPVNSPSSVVSSPGSSVAGSAFAFISGGTSAFAFAPSVSSPLPEPTEREIFEQRESIVADEDDFSPVATHYDVALEEGDGRGSTEEDSEWTSSHEEKAVEEQAPAETELDGEKAFAGFNDYADVRGDDVPSSPKVEAAQSFDFQSSSGVSHEEEDVNGEDDGFGGFNDAIKPATSASSEAEPTISFASSTQGTAWASSSSTQADSSFGFISSTQTTAQAGEDDDDDGFGGFGQSSAVAGGDDDDDFGDFGTSDAWGSSTVSGGDNGDDDDDDFGDFTPSSSSQQWGEATTSSTTVAASSTSWGSVVYEPQPVSIAVPTDLNEFFGSAFPASKAPVATSLLPKPTPTHGSGVLTMTASAIFDQANGGAVYKSFHASLQEYRTMLTAEHDEHPQQQQPSFESEALRLKYLKYVLTEKLTEASRPDGVFPHGSEKYHLFASIAESGHEKNMRDALAQLQEGLFQGSVNEAVMRIAKQAALSAKARIAEQAAQQQAHARGSLLATTRHFLSRNAASSSSGGPGSADKDSRSSRTGSGSLGVLTPTSASVHKMSRLAFQNGQESSAEVGNSSGYGSGEDTGSDVSVGEASGHSEADVAAPPTGGSGPPSGSSSRGGGGLMKKFHERLTSFSSTKQRARTVSLRRMGQSSEDVVKMELHMESINGGFDEVKWRCAVFLYESDEVAHLAPSQIKILAYPSNQLLSGKSDRSALSKFFKPGTIWSIDIGANSNAGVSME